MVDLSPKGIGKRIRLRRIKVGLSQPKLAKELGIPQQTIGGWEKGAAKRPRYLLEAAKVLCTTPEWLLREEGPEEVEPPPKVRLAVEVESLDSEQARTVLEFVKKLKSSKAA